jgi:hypothetical protein
LLRGELRLAEQDFRVLRFVNALQTSAERVAKAPMASEMPAMAMARASRFLENLISLLVGCLLGSIGGGSPYPSHAAKLADLAARIAANDAAIERVNQRLPDGATWIAGAEMIARQVRNFNDIATPVPRITLQLRLPAFRYSVQRPYAWPR